MSAVLAKAAGALKQNADAGADAKRDDEGEGFDKMADFSKVVKVLNLDRIKKAGAPRKPKEKRNYKIEESLNKIESLPFSPRRGPMWSPRAVAADAIDYLDQQSPDGSPIRNHCKESMERQLPVRAIVHHVHVDPAKVKKTTEDDSTLQNVTSVKRRTQRALTAEEVAANAEKSIAFFRNARDTNATVARDAKKNGGWSKLRKKFLRL